MHDIVEVQKLWNEKVGKILQFSSLASIQGVICALDSVLELAVALSMKYSALYAEVGKRPTTDTLRYVDISMKDDG